PLVCYLCGTQRDLRWHTADIDAGAAQRARFDHGDSGAGLGGSYGGGEGAAAATEDRDVQVLCAAVGVTIGFAFQCIGAIVGPHSGTSVELPIRRWADSVPCLSCRHRLFPWLGWLLEPGWIADVARGLRQLGNAGLGIVEGNGRRLVLE